MERATKEQQLTANGAVGQYKGSNRYVATRERLPLDQNDPRSFLFGTVSLSNCPFPLSKLSTFGIRDLNIKDEFDMPAYALPHKPSREQQQFIKDAFGMSWLGTLEHIPWMSAYLVVKQLPNKVIPIAACEDVRYHRDYRMLPMPYSVIAYNLDEQVKRASLFLDILPEYHYGHR